jgi:hypothetical protein
VGRGDTAEFKVQAFYPDGTSSGWSESSGLVSVPQPYNDYYPFQQIPTITASAKTASDTSIDVKFGTDSTNTTGTFVYYVVAKPYDSEAQDHVYDSPGISLPAGQSSTKTLTGLTPGVKYDIQVSADWYLPGPGLVTDNPIHAHTSATTTGAVAPAAPASVSAAVDPKDDTKVNVHWQNTPGDETGYKLDRSSDGGLTFTRVSFLGADQTSFQDATAFQDQATELRARDSLVYRIAALKGLTASTPKYSDPTEVYSPVVFEIPNTEIHRGKTKTLRLRVVNKTNNRPLKGVEVKIAKQGDGLDVDWHTVTDNGVSITQNISDDDGYVYIDVTAQVVTPKTKDSFDVHPVGAGSSNVTEGDVVIIH